MARRGQVDGTASQLRRARLARNWTLEDVVREIDVRMPGGASGVSPSRVSSWELGKGSTSIAYRKVLCEIYEQPPEDLFKHQDDELVSSANPRLIATARNLLDAMTGVVESAEEFLVVTGSRSRDADYLKAIEEMLAKRPHVVHYRVLFGPPHVQLLKDHLLKLLALRDPEDWSFGMRRLHIGMLDDWIDLPERFICASEKMAVLPIPSFTSAEAFDAGVWVGDNVVPGLIDHVRQLYMGSQRVETTEAVQRLQVVRGGDDVKAGID